jgi:hypothetical protein
MTLTQNGVGTHFARMEGYDSTLLAWVASPPFSAGGGGGSTQVSVSSLAGTVTVAPNSTGFATAAGFTFNSSGELLTVGGGSASGSTIVTVSTGHVTVDNFSTTVSVSSLAGRVLVDQNSSAWQVQIHGDSTAVQGGTWNINVVTSVSSLSTGHVTVDNFSTQVAVSSVAGVVTVTPQAGSTFAVRPVQSSRADLNVTSFNADNAGNLIESSTRAVGTNSTMRGLAVRSITPDSTTVSTRCASTGANTIISSAATQIYVYAYFVSAAISSVTGAGLAPNLVTVNSGAGGTELWRWAYMASTQNTFWDSRSVTPPAYLFRTGAGAALVLTTPATAQAGSTGLHCSFAYWRE